MHGPERHTGMLNHAKSADIWLVAVRPNFKGIQLNTEVLHTTCSSAMIQQSLNEIP